MSKAKVPVVILVRVSTVKQETQRQISELQAYADCKGYERWKFVAKPFQVALPMTTAMDCVTSKRWLSSGK